MTRYDIYFPIAKDKAYSEMEQFIIRNEKNY